jgi:hypothetical protein
VRVLILLLLLVAGVGCRSPRGGATHSYLSANRSSFAFLKETARKARGFRRANLKNTLDFKGRRPGNVARGKHSAKLAAQSIWKGQWREFKNMLRTVGEERKSGAERMASIRFGHLDSGD